jgi:hypothetical protein
VAFRSTDNPDEWVRYIGYGKSRLWPTIHADYATHWRPLPEPPAALAQPSPLDTSGRVEGSSSSAHPAACAFGGTAGDAQCQSEGGAS